jgi:hypothetical protein
MDIINIVKIIANCVESIHSFIITDSQLSSSVIREAEKFFIEECREYDSLSEEEIDIILEEGYYQTEEGGIQIVWSTDTNLQS